MSSPKLLQTKQQKVERLRAAWGLGGQLHSDNGTAHLLTRIVSGCDHGASRVES